MTLKASIQPKLSEDPHLRVVDAVELSMYSYHAKRQGHLDQSLVLINQAIKLADAADFYYSKYFILTDLKKFDQAKLTLKEAERVKPGKARYLMRIAIQDSKQKQWDACIDYAGRAIYRGDETRRPYVTRGFCQERKGFLREALSDYLTATKLDPDFKWVQSAIQRVKKLMPSKKIP